MLMRNPFRSVLPLLLLVAQLLAGAAPRVPIVRVALKDGEPNGYTDRPWITADGNLISFRSSANNLVAKDTNGSADVFVLNRRLGSIARLNVSPYGAEANGHSDRTCISEDGQYVAFSSHATNLVDGDPNGAADIFFRDTLNDQIFLFSGDNRGVPGDDNCWAPAISPDAHYVAFVSRSTNLVPRTTKLKKPLADIYLHETMSGRCYLVTTAPNGDPADGDSASPSVCTKARYVVFSSVAKNLVNDDTNGKSDVFLYDFRTRRTALISRGLDGRPGDGPSVQPVISGDGTRVVFASAAGNLVPDDTNRVTDIFSYDVATAKITRVSMTADGKEALDFSDLPSVSGNGRVVAFRSAAALLPDDNNTTYDIYVRNLGTGATLCASLASDGAWADSFSTVSCLDAAGKTVVFTSDAANLVPDDTNATFDVFVRDLVW